MNREFLKSLELTDEQIEKIMAEYGKSINSYKEKVEELGGLSEKVQNYERQLEELQNTLQAKEQELTQVDELQSKLKSYELENLKIKIANQAGIPLDLAGRLSGETEEEIKADAEKLAGLITIQKPTLPLKPTEPQNVDPKEQAYSKLLENLV